jgi:DNA-binding transcriptional LysR family regulator
VLSADGVPLSAACALWHPRADAWNISLTSARDGREHRVQPNAVLAANNSLALRDALLAGAGLALIPRMYVAGDLAAGRLQEALIDYDKPVVGLHAVFPARRHVGSHARAFVDFLTARFGNPPYWDAPLRPSRSRRLDRR